MVRVGVSEVLGDAWDVYTLLFRRSVPLAALVFAVVDGVQKFIFAFDNRGARFGLAIATFVLVVAGPILVQGALVEIVRNVHEGRRPATIAELLSLAFGRLPSLLWAAIVYGFGTVFGLLLLIVPGLLVLSRWCLMAPLIMLEGHTGGEARARSRELVKPYTWPVLGVVLLTFFLTTAITGLFGAVHTSPVIGWLISVIASALTVPFYAHVLSVLYYRITDPENRVVHPDVRRWQSVWEGA